MGQGQQEDIEFTDEQLEQLKKIVKAGSDDGICKEAEDKKFESTASRGELMDLERELMSPQRDETPREPDTEKAKAVWNAIDTLAQWGIIDMDEIGADEVSVFRQLYDKGAGSGR